jgi:hypothetical protein
MEIPSEVGIDIGKSIRTWLFNPFHYIAGGRALTIGVVIILLAGFIGSLSNSHFDGVLDFHTGAAAPVWVFIFEGLLDWIVLSGLLLLGGKIISRSRVRALDVLGTQALARSPGLVTVLFALLPGYQRFIGNLSVEYTKTLPDLQSILGDYIIFIITVLLVAILMLIWMVMLMYRAYSVSCNVAGSKAIGVFIACLVIGEVISKVLIMAVTGYL